MINCKTCRNTKNCVYAGADREMEGCVDRIPTTNFDAIHAMTIDELAEFIEEAICPPICYSKHAAECVKNDCIPCWKRWLEAEVSL